MSKRLVALVLVLGALAACGVSPKKQLQNIIASVDRTQSRSRDFTYTDDTLDGKQKITVKGKVQDDFRYTGVVYLNGKPLYEMIVSDDAAALRILDVGRTKRVIDLAKSYDKVTGEALEQGKWVVDFTAAPALKIVAPSTSGTTGSGTTANLAAAQSPIGNDPFFDAADALHYTERNITSGLGLIEFNPDDINYNPADDPWSKDKDLNLRNQGILRYDLGQPPLPTRASRGQQQQLPGVSDFRKLALYNKAGRTIMVREQISIDDRKEFRRALVGRAAKYYLQLRDAARNGAVSSPLRERMMSYTVEPYTGSDIELPKDAVRGILTQVLGDQGLKTLFTFKVIQRAGTAALPGALPVAPSGSPSASASPAASTTPGASATPAVTATTAPGSTP